MGGTPALNGNTPLLKIPHPVVIGHEEIISSLMKILSGWLPFIVLENAM